MTNKKTPLLSPGINVLIDGQWGSTGKGKLSAYLARRSDVVWNTADFQPNAGHTVVLNGKSYVTKTIPSGFVNRDARLFLTAASTINVETLLKEIDMLSDFFVEFRLSIHPMAGVVMPEDIEEERQTMREIASTMTGGGAALRRKIARKAVVAKDVPELQRWVSDRTPEILDTARRGGIILAESAQGFDLSLNHGLRYPFTTSRDVTTANVLANLGAPPQLMSRCWASMRTFPIRVGHLVVDGVKQGDSGPFYPDQKELTWEEVAAITGSPAVKPELTTVTKRIRRIFTWSPTQYRKFLSMCQPTDVFLNFVNYLDRDIAGNMGSITMGALRESYPNVHAQIEGMTDQAILALPFSQRPTVRLLGTGADDVETLEIEQ